MKRIESLDSVRGIAALVVVIHHMETLIKRESWSFEWVFSWTPAHFLINSGLAVKIFFILSGFVLAIPYFRAKAREPYGDFIVKRICRIYLPFLASIVLSILQPFQGEKMSF